MGTTESWLKEVIDAAEEVAETTFLADKNGADSLEHMPGGREGALLPLQRGNESIHVGVFADEDGCKKLTKALLQMEDDEEVATEDITDAVGEIVNILGGIVQRSVDAKDDGHVALGLPVYVRGEVFPPPRSETLVAKMNLGPAEANIVVMRGELRGR